MRRLVAFGNNATGNLDPGGEAVLSTPRDITDTVGCTEVVWHGWTCTIGKSPGGYKAWGAPPFVQDGIQIITCSAEPLKFVGVDSPIGYLGEDRRVYTFDGRTSREDWSWADVAVTGLGTVYAFEKDTLYRFESLEHFLDFDVGSQLQHPAVNENDSRTPPKLYVSESRCLVHSHYFLYEVVSSPAPEHSLSLRQIEDVAGLDVEIRAGARNRFAIACQGGSAYLLDTRDEQATLVDGEYLDLDIAEDDVWRYTVGSDFEVVETGGGVVSRGSNAFGQLGGEPEEDGWAGIEVEGSIVDIVSSRWSTIITLDDEEDDGEDQDGEEDDGEDEETVDGEQDDE